MFKNTTEFFKTRETGKQASSQFIYALIEKSYKDLENLSGKDRLQEAIRGYEVTLELLILNLYRSDHNETNTRFSEIFNLYLKGNIVSVDNMPVVANKHNFFHYNHCVNFFLKEICNICISNKLFQPLIELPGELTKLYIIDYFKSLVHTSNLHLETLGFNERKFFIFLQSLLNFLLVKTELKKDVFVLLLAYEISNILEENYDKGFSFVSEHFLTEINIANRTFNYGDKQKITYNHAVTTANQLDKALNNIEEKLITNDAETITILQDYIICKTIVFNEESCLNGTTHAESIELFNHLYSYFHLLKTHSNSPYYLITTLLATSFPDINFPQLVTNSGEITINKFTYLQKRMIMSGWFSGFSIKPAIILAETLLLKRETLVVKLALAIKSLTSRKLALLTLDNILEIKQTFNNIAFSFEQLINDFNTVNTILLNSQVLESNPFKESSNLYVSPHRIKRLAAREAQKSDSPSSNSASKKDIYEDITLYLTKLSFEKRDQYTSRIYEFIDQSQSIRFNDPTNTKLIDVYLNSHPELLNSIESDTRITLSIVFELTKIEKNLMPKDPINKGLCERPENNFKK